MNKFIGQTIVEIQQDLINKKYSVLDMVYYYLESIKVNKDYNAVIYTSESIISKAKQIDAKIDKGESLGKLFGVVVMLKDNIASKEMPFSAGAKALEGSRAKRDAHIVKLLQDQDALILGKANLSEWANYMSKPSSNGFSVIGGQTKNARGDFDAGGSSSGSAVSVALNLCTASIGSETCGSLVYPASINHVVTIKPTLGLISRDLVVPITQAQDSLGPMTRCVEDLMKMFEVCIDYDVMDDKTNIAKSFDKNVFSKPLVKGFLENKRVGLVKGESKYSDSIKKQLEALGAHVIELDIDQEKLGIKMTEILDYGIVHDVGSFLESKDIVTTMKSLEDVVAFNKEKPEERMPYGQGLFDYALKHQVTDLEYKNIKDENHSIASKLINKSFADYGLDVIASYSTDMSVIYSVCGYPSVVVPAGFEDEGEPYGVTFVGKELDDVKLIRFAYDFEQRTVVCK